MNGFYHTNGKNNKGIWNIKITIALGYSRQYCSITDAYVYNFPKDEYLFVFDLLIFFSCWSLFSFECKHAKNLNYTRAHH